MTEEQKLQVVDTCTPPLSVSLILSHVITTQPTHAEKEVGEQEHHCSEDRDLVLSDKDIKK